MARWHNLLYTLPTLEYPSISVWRVSLPKKVTDGSSESDFRPKDIVIAVYNVSREGKKKLLAKNRFDLFHHGGRDYEKVAEAEAARASLRFKLYPETKKVIKCSLSVAISQGERNNDTGADVADVFNIDDGDDDVSSTISSRRSSVLPQNYQPPGPASSPSISVASSQRCLPPDTTQPRLPTNPAPLPASVATESTAAPPSSNHGTSHNQVEDVKSPTVQMIESIFKDYTPSPSVETPPTEETASSPPKPAVVEEKEIIPSGFQMTNGSRSPPKRKPDGVTDEVKLPPPPPPDVANVTSDAAVDSPPSPATPPPTTPPRMPSFRLDVRTPDPLPSSNGNNRTLKAMTPGTPSSEAEKARKDVQKEELIEWAKLRLGKYKQIKITNLSSSWRSGLAFCSLIHSAYPELIPLSQLKAFNADKVNGPLALSASKMIGVDMSPPLAESITGIKLKPDVVAVYLERLRGKLEERKEFEEAELQQWRRGCYERFELWANEFVVQSPVESRPKSVVVKTPDPQERPKSIILEGSPSENRKRVKKLIEEAHLSMSSQEKDSSPLTANDSECEEAVTLAGAMTTSVTLDEIATERGEIEEQREEMDIEMNVLQRFMREDDSEDSERLERWLELVNAKNALDRRQMQLNIKEKEASISRRHNTIMAELQKVRSWLISSYSSMLRGVGTLHFSRNCNVTILL